MNRYLLCVVGALVASACDDGMKRPGLSPPSFPPQGGSMRAPSPTPVVLTPTVQAAPNPTLQNEREGTPELTAMDQGSSAAETTITANIRKGVMAQQALSFTARNVKVVTVGSRVTLRGAVSSADEKNVIAALARGTSGVSEVDDQLEVKP